jgi:hypothetical protein
MYLVQSQNNLHMFISDLCVIIYIWHILKHKISCHVSEQLTYNYFGTLPDQLYGLFENIEASCHFLSLFCVSFCVCCVSFCIFYLISLITFHNVIYCKKFNIVTFKIKYFLYIIRHHCYRIFCCFLVMCNFFTFMYVFYII